MPLQRWKATEPSKNLNGRQRPSAASDTGKKHTVAGSQAYVVAIAGCEVRAVVGSDNPTSTHTGPIFESNGSMIGVQFEGKPMEWFLPQITLGRPTLS